MSCLLQRAIFIAGGFAYGVLLAALSPACAGAGHGTYIPAAVSSAPMIVVGIVASFVAPPFVWAVLAFLAGAGNRNLFVGAAMIHYFSAVALLFTEYGDWAQIGEIAAGFSIWFALYAGGQWMLWSVYRKAAGSRP